MAQHIQDRIRAALHPDAKLADMRQVLADTRTALDQAVAGKEEAEARRCDPMLTAEEAEAEQLRYETHRLDVMRFTKAIEQLEGRIAAIEAAQAERARQAEVAAIVARRDELAKELAETVPGLIDALVDYIKRIEANDKELERAGRLPSAEAVARGCPASFYVGGGSPVMRLRDMRIPVFGPEDVNATAWPDQRAAARAAIAAERQQRERREAERKRVEAQQMGRRRYAVKRPPSDNGAGPLLLNHAAGSSWVDTREVECILFPDQVTAAQDAGFIVTLLPGRVAKLSARKRDTHIEFETLDGRRAVVGSAVGGVAWIHALLTDEQARHIKGEVTVEWLGEKSAAPKRAREPEQVAA